MASWRILITFTSHSQLLKARIRLYSWKRLRNSKTPRRQWNQSKSSSKVKFRKHSKNSWRKTLSKKKSKKNYSLQTKSLPKLSPRSLVSTVRQGRKPTSFSVALDSKCNPFLRDSMILSWSRCNLVLHIVYLDISSLLPPKR